MKLVKGTPVVSLADGSTLGAVNHVYFDPERRAVVGFTFRERGWLFGGASGLVDTADVHAVGPHAVTIEDSSVVRSEVAVDAWRGALLDLESLLHRTVITEGGRLIGQVGAIEFGAATYGLAALEVMVSNSDRHIRIDADEIQTIGEEFIVIADTASADRQASARPPRAPHVLPFQPAWSAVESWPNVRQRISA